MYPHPSQHKQSTYTVNVYSQHTESLCGTIRSGMVNNEANHGLPSVDWSHALKSRTGTCTLSSAVGMLRRLHSPSTMGESLGSLSICVIQGVCDLMCVCGCRCGCVCVCMHGMCMIIGVCMHRMCMMIGVCMHGMCMIIGVHGMCALTALLCIIPQMQLQWVSSVVGIYALLPVCLLDSLVSESVCV